jgi:hypothetical protein
MHVCISYMPLVIYVYQLHAWPRVIITRLRVPAEIAFTGGRKGRPRKRTSVQGAQRNSGPSTRKMQFTGKGGDARVCAGHVCISYMPLVMYVYQLHA